MWAGYDGELAHTTGHESERAGSEGGEGRGSPCGGSLVYGRRAPADGGSNQGRSDRRIGPGQPGLYRPRVRPGAVAAARLGIRAITMNEMLAASIATRLLISAADVRPS
jgi:hypothetical protein